MQLNGDATLRAPRFGMASVGKDLAPPDILPANLFG